GAAAHNLKHQVADVRLFEVGRVFLPVEGGGLPEEPVRVAAVLAGPRPGWLVADGEVDVFDLKGPLERLLEELLGPRAAGVRFAPRPEPWLHPGVAAAIELD